MCLPLNTVNTIISGRRFGRDCWHSILGRRGRTPKRSWQ